MATILFYVAAIVVIIGTLFAAILNAPDVALSSNITSAIVTMGHYIASVDKFFPIGALIAAFISVHLVTEGAIFGYKGVMWVLRKLPGVS